MAQDSALDQERSSARVSSFARARERYAAGDLEGALTLLPRAPRPGEDGPFLLACEIALRLGRAEPAATALTEHLGTLRGEVAGARARILLGAAALARDDFDGGFARLEDARARSRNRCVDEEAALYRAALFARVGKRRLALAEIKVALRSSDPSLNARAHRFQGDICADAERYGDALAAYARGVRTLASTAPIDDRLLISLLNRIAIGSSDTASVGVREALAEIEGRAWDPAVAPLLLEARCHLAVSASRRERHAEAAAGLLRVIVDAGASPLGVLALVRASANASGAGESRAASAFYAAAVALADRIAWERVPPHAWYPLLNLTIVAARRHDLAAAHHARRRFAELFGPVRFAVVRRLIRRRPLFKLTLLLADHASAITDAAEPGDCSGGIRRLRELQRHCVRLGFAWRAIEIREDLYELTGQPALLDANRREKRKLLLDGEGIATRAEETSGPRLSPRQARIISAVAAGRATDEIAQAVGLSSRTVKNQLHLIYETLGIERPTRAKLAAYVHANPDVLMTAGS